MTAGTDPEKIKAERMEADRAFDATPVGVALARFVARHSNAVIMDLRPGRAERSSVAAWNDSDGALRNLKIEIRKLMGEQR